LKTTMDLTAIVINQAQCREVEVQVVHKDQHMLS
jgi:hypothetical protein